MRNPEPHRLDAPARVSRTLVIADYTPPEPPRGRERIWRLVAGVPERWDWMTLSWVPHPEMSRDRLCILRTLREWPCDVLQTHDALFRVLDGFQWRLTPDGELERRTGHDGPWGYVLTDVRPFPPVVVDGLLALYEETP